VADRADRRPPSARPAWLAAAAVLVTLIGAAFAGTVGGAADFPLAIHDASGRIVQIPARPQRIISLAPSVTEILLALGLDRELVGVSDADDYPPDRVQGKIRVGGVIINVERVVTLRPDLVVGLQSIQQDQLARLRALHLRILALEASSIDETIEQIRLLGRAAGRSAEAGRLAASLAHRAGSLRPGPRRSVYIEVWHQPVIAAGSGTLVDDLLRRAGGVNIFGGSPGYPQVAAERIVVRDPEVIFMVYPGRDQLKRRPGWGTIRAVRAGRVYELPASIVTRPGPRIVDGLALVRRLLQESP
jgi:iron complex transport system substrate-binding protein